MIFAAASVLLIAAASAAAAPGLSLKISGAAQVDDVDNLAVVATIANTGDETLKLFNDPRGTLSAFKANSFAITSASGAAPKFVGAKVKYGFEAAVKSDDPSVFTVLAPGQSIDVTHDLSDAYNFNTTGAGAYVIEPSKLFHYLDSAGKVNEIYAQVTDAHTTSLRGKLVSSKVQARSGHSKRSFTGCTASQQDRIIEAMAAAQIYSQNAYLYLANLASITPRLVTWFGAYTPDHLNLVGNHFYNIMNNGIGTYSFDCTCTKPDTFAFVQPDHFGLVTVCGAFWTAPPTGSNSKAGTIVHESSHFTKNGGTEDYVYGLSGCQALARSNSAQAVKNADSHEYFAENNPPLY